MSELINRIRVLRAEKRMSQQDLANAIGVSRKTMNTIENGKFIPTAVTALKISGYFNTPFDDVFQLKTKPPTDRMDEQDNLLPSFIKRGP